MATARTQRLCDVIPSTDALGADDAGAVRGRVPPRGTADVRAAGLVRFVFGSDAPVFEPVRSASVLRDVLGLTTSEAEVWWGRAASALVWSQPPD
jgi:hypothetical protein